MGSTLSPSIEWGSEGLRSLLAPPRGLERGGRRRSVGDEDRSHSAPSNCTVKKRHSVEVRTLLNRRKWESGLRNRGPRDRGEGVKKSRLGEGYVVGNSFR